jgi:ElaB/YqjD/DUF883 family membrane-anchored ribosome-binding protein
VSAVRDAENSNGNHAAGETEQPLQEPRSIGDHGRRIHHDVATLTAEVRSTTADLERYLTEQVRRRPYSTLGVATGIGYVLGGGLRSRLTLVLLGSATRLAAALAVREIGARILQRYPASARSKSA